MPAQLRSVADTLGLMAYLLVLGGGQLDRDLLRSVSAPGSALPGVPVAAQPIPEAAPAGAYVARVAA